MWTLLYLLPRWPYAFELYLRPVLRQDPWLLAWALPPPAPLVHACFAAATVSLVALILSYRVRVAHGMLLISFFAITCFDTIMPRGYGFLGLLQWALLWLTPHDERGERPLSVGTRILMLQFSSVYIWTVLAKLFGGSGWWSGKVLLHTFHGDSFGNFLLSTLPVTPAMGFALAWTTLLVELFVGLGLWFERTWKLASALMLMMHLMMTLSLRVSPLFHLLMVIHLVLFARSDLRAGDAAGARGGSESSR